MCSHLFKSLSMAPAIVVNGAVKGFLCFYATQHKQDLFLSACLLKLGLTGYGQGAALLPAFYISALWPFHLHQAPVQAAHRLSFLLLSNSELQYMFLFLVRQKMKICLQTVQNWLFSQRDPCQISSLSLIHI